MRYEVCSKNKVNIQISQAMYIRFSIFVSYVGTLVPNVCSQFQQYSIFCLFVRGIKFRSVLRVLASFCCRKKWIKEYASNFVKNGIRCSKTLEMLKVAYDECTVSQKSVYKWYKLFTKGREEVNGDARPGRHY